MINEKKDTFPSKITYDVAVIGGGINGCGIAADAATRGLSVILLEKDDLAQHTSSASSKLIHGGLRYLENGHFSLVKKALKERDTLLKIAPHLIHPQEFIIPQTPFLKNGLLVRAGLFLYDNLDLANTLPKSKYLKKQKNPLVFNPLNQTCHSGFRYYDAMCDDNRLVITNALQAKASGADILTHHRVYEAQAYQSEWKLTVRDHDNQTKFIYAKCLINATGPWALETTKNLQLSQSNHMDISLIKGSHILVEPFYQGTQAYLLQNHDNRVIFVIPYHGKTLIGTTEVAITNITDNIRISEEEIIYLLDAVNTAFSHQLKAKDIVHTWSGVRPLIHDANKNMSKLSRDYQFHITTLPAPLAQVLGGKITTYRRLASDLVDALSPFFNHLQPSKTDKTPLFGGLLGQDTFQKWALEKRSEYHWVTDDLFTRLTQTYGTKFENILKNAANMSQLGQHFGHGLTQQEVDYLIEHEWATSADDILWRRTSLGLDFSEQERHELNDYLNECLLIS